MKTLRILSSEIVETDFSKPAIHHHTVGFHLPGPVINSVAVQLGPKALILTDGKDSVAVPLEALFAAITSPALEATAPSAKAP